MIDDNTHDRYMAEIISTPECFLKNNLNFKDRWFNT